MMILIVCHLFLINRK